MASETDDEMKNYLSKAAEVLEKYDPKKISLRLWRIQFFTLVNQYNVPYGRKKEFLCSMLAPTTINHLETYLHPRKLIELSYEEVVEALTTCPLTRDPTLFEKKPNIFKQLEEETIEAFARRLKRLQKWSTLGFKSNNLLNYQFLNGLKDRVIAAGLKRKNFSSFREMVGRAIELNKKKGSDPINAGASTSAGPSTSTGAYTSPGPSSSAGPSTSAGPSRRRY